MLKKILLIGEHSPWSETLINALSSLGSVDTTKEVIPLEQVQKEKYDLIIIDAAFPKEIGKVINSIHREIPELRIVVMTASPTWKRSREVFLAGAADYLRKSADGKALLETFSKILEK